MLPEPQTPSPKSFWPSLLVVSVLAFGICFLKVGSWPWDHDEVPSLMEMGLLDSTGTEQQFGNQIGRLPKLAPMWYSTQKLLLKVLPQNEFGTRVFPATCAALTIILAFVLGWHWRGPQFAVGLAILIGMSQCFIWLSQQNRFYSAATLMQTIVLALVWQNKKQTAFNLAACAIASLMAALTHNLLVVVIGIGFIAAIICALLGAISKAVLWRSAVSAVVAGLVYFVYLRPIMSGWVSGGTGGTNELVSFAAQIGLPSLALATLGIGLSLRWPIGSSDMLWWTVTAIGSLMFVALSPWLLGNWNARYALLFMPPFWVMGAYAAEQVAMRLANRWQQVAWYGCIALLLLPKFASHYRDGSRHDFRTAAEIVSKHERAGEPIYCNFPDTLNYYLDIKQSARATFWPPAEKDAPPAKGSYLLVFSSNAFDPLITVPQHHCDVLGEVVTRRFDEQSHIVRVYRISPDDGT